MKNEEYVLHMADFDGAFRTEDGTLLVECLFINDKRWYTKYIPENDVSVGSVYETVYKPTKKGLYKISFKRKEN